MYDWNDLKYLVAVARHGSTRALEVNQSTVQRRLAEVERQLGHSLVERHQSGYRLTNLGEMILPHAESVASIQKYRSFCRIRHGDARANARLRSQLVHRSSLLKADSYARSGLFMRANVVDQRVQWRRSPSRASSAALKSP